MWSLGQGRPDSSGGKGNRLVFWGCGLEPHLGRHPPPPGFTTQPPLQFLLRYFLKLADNQNCHNSEHSSQRAKRVANNMSSYGRDMVQNGVGFMHSVSLKSHGPVLLSMKLLPYPVNQSCFPSALDKLNETALRRMVPAVTSLENWLQGAIF